MICVFITKAIISEAMVILDGPIGGIYCMDKTTPVVPILIKRWKSNQISLETYVQAQVSTKIYQI